MDDTEKKGGITPAYTNTGSEDIRVVTADQYGETKRGLSPRHVQLMAIGGSIGTGLWVSNFFLFSMISEGLPKLGCVGTDAADHSA